MNSNNKTRLRDIESLLNILKNRFEEHAHRHSGIKWTDVKIKLEENPSKLEIISGMERTGGEPDVVGQDQSTDEYLFYDCSKESPKGRRSLCYDHVAQVNRKKYPPQNNVEEIAKELGIELLDESQYRFLQKLEKVDTKTSSWIKTPDKIRDLGGALFGDFRYGTVFIYHNGADSYYGSRGFRGYLKV